MQPAIKMALRIARQSSDYLKHQFQRRDSTAGNVAASLKALQHVEQNIYDNCTEQLRRAYRDHFIAPSGSASAAGNAKSWHIFPVLGAENFVRGLPEFALALMQKSGDRPENLLIINPVQEEEFAFSKGYGAAINSKRIRSSGLRDLSKGLCATNVAELAREPEDDLAYGEIMTTLARHCSGLRWSGCPVLELARVAAGQLDLAVLGNLEPEITSMAALIANETGSLCGDFRGNPMTESTTQVVLANPKLFKEATRLLHPFRARLSQ